LDQLLPAVCNNRNVTLAPTDPQQPATPLYNSSLLEDAVLAEHVAFLHSVFTDSTVYVEAAMLLKVWLRQRQSSDALDSFNGFLLEMLLAYLHSTRKINKQISSYQVFKLVIQFIGRPKHKRRAKCGKLNAISFLILSLLFFFPCSYPCFVGWYFLQ
jgi:hypothetical protein